MCDAMLLDFRKHMVDWNALNLKNREIQKNNNKTVAECRRSLFNQYNLQHNINSTDTLLHSQRQSNRTKFLLNIVTSP